MVSAGALRARAVLPLADKRAAHVARVLQLRDGDTVRVGVLDGGADDAASVRWLWREGSEGRWSQNAPRGDRRERLRLEDMVGALEREVELPEALELTFTEGEPGAGIPAPRVDLLLAPPSPRRLKRLLPRVVQLGVGTVVLCGAAGVGKRDLDAHWLRKPEALRAILVEGLVQSGETAVPKVVVAKRLGRFLRDGELERLFPTGRVARFFVTPSGRRMLEQPVPPELPGGRVLLAVGPDDGWREPDEAGLLAAAGFAPLSLGPRAATPEVNACAGLALAVDAAARWGACL